MQRLCHVDDLLILCSEVMITQQQRQQECLVANKTVSCPLLTHPGWVAQQLLSQAMNVEGQVHMLLQPTRCMIASMPHCNYATPHVAPPGSSAVQSTQSVADSLGSISPCATMVHVPLIFTTSGTTRLANGSHLRVQQTTVAVGTSIARVTDRVCMLKSVTGCSAAVLCHLHHCHFGRPMVLSIAVHCGVTSAASCWSSTGRPANNSGELLCEHNTARTCCQQPSILCS